MGGKKKKKETTFSWVLASLANMTTRDFGRRFNKSQLRKIGQNPQF